MSEQPFSYGTARIVPMGVDMLVVRFADRLDDAANRTALAFARDVESDGIGGLVEIVPSLVSVGLRYDPEVTTAAEVAGEVRLRMVRLSAHHVREAHRHTVSIAYDGPDLYVVAEQLGMPVDTFIARHHFDELRVLAIGFAPGFVYCGFHAADLVVPRRTEVRPGVPAGTVLFAAGQTAICATAIPTGWHVIGHTDLRNFDPARNPPSLLRAGDAVRFLSA
jgi:KipI family sensor histidine kinase inhibitor